MFDFSKFFEAVASNGPIVVLVVLGLVTFYGKMGIQGRTQLVSALATGLVFGGAFMIAALGLPATFAGWFSVVIYGLMMGLVASGIYDTGKELMAKVASKILGIDPPDGKG